MTDVTILDRTKHYLVAVKPRGVLSQSAEKPTAVPDMVSLLSEKIGIPVYPVHRLDRETEGIMLYALTKAGASRFGTLFSENAVRKTYLAAVHGVPAEESGTFCDLLFRDAAKNKSYVVDRMRKGVREARLSYELCETVYADGAPYSLVRIFLDTGRTHQIRVQFSHRGLPLAGDSRYGGGTDVPLCLCCCELAFLCPFSGEEKRYEIRPQNEFFAKFSLFGQNLL